MDFIIPPRPIPAENELSANYPILLGHTAKHSIGWQTWRRSGTQYVTTMHASGRWRVLHKYPLTDEGWSSAWREIVSLDQAAAIAAIQRIRERSGDAPTDVAPPPTPAEQQLGPQVHDGLAVASLILSLVWLGGLGALLAVIFGHMSIQEAKRANRIPSGLAVAGMIIGLIGLAALVIIVIALIAHAASQPDPTQQWINCLQRQLNNPSVYCPPAPNG
jgi:hypothetical protein